MTVEVRDATAEDAAAVAEVAGEGWRDTYAGLLSDATIEAFVERAYSIERIEARIERDTFLVATDGGSVVAFADARPGDDRLDLFAIYARPRSRGRGAGTALLIELRRRHPGLPVAADVLRDNRKGEVFYEARGFSPRETIETELLGETVVERRWWLPVE